MTSRSRLLSAWFLFAICVSASAKDRPVDDFNPYEPPRDPLLPVHKQLESLGITLNARYTGEWLANVSGGLRTGSTYDQLLQASVLLDLEKLFHWRGASFYASALLPIGDGLTEKHLGDLGGVNDIDANDSIRLWELWFEQAFPGDVLSIRIGQMSVDNEFFACVSTSIFLNSPFNTANTLVYNSQLPIFPIGGLGARLLLQPSKNWTFRVAALDADPGDELTNDRHGTRFHINLHTGVVVLSELVYSLNPSGKGPVPPGNYIVGGFYDSASYKNNDLFPARNSNYALYGIIDQYIYLRENPPTPGEKAREEIRSEIASTPVEETQPTGITLFCHLSGAPKDKNIVSFYADGGMSFIGLVGNRERDIASIGATYTRIAKDYDLGSGLFEKGHEVAIEATYRIALNDHMDVQPDFQYIIHPGAGSGIPNATVLGMRFDIGF